MKTLYLIRHAASDWSDTSLFDEERKLTLEGKKSVEKMGRYLKEQKITPDLILTSCAIRAQDTALGLSDILGFNGKIHYLKELYLTPIQRLKETLVLQPDACDTLFLIGHNTQLKTLLSAITNDTIEKIPAMGVIAVQFDIDEWSEMESKRGEMKYAISPDDALAS